MQRPVKESEKSGYKDDATIVSFFFRTCSTDGSGATGSVSCVAARGLELWQASHMCAASHLQ